MNLRPDTITVSGGSSGAYFTQMMQIIYSKTIKGSGNQSGGPFKIGVMFPTKEGMAGMNNEARSATTPAVTSYVVQSILESFKNGFIDDPVNLKGRPVATLVETKDNSINVPWKLAEIQAYKFFRANTYERTINLDH
jgi:hypothetical protein